MSELLEKVKAHRKAILLGEIGALLHMFGKCSREFLIANSQENQALPQNQRVRDLHQDLKHLPNLKPLLEQQKLTDAFAFPLDGQQKKLSGNFTDFITKYKGDNSDYTLLKLFNTCHRMTSADEKGVVRRKQSKDDMWIATPFGYRVRKLDLDVIDAVRMKMDSGLSQVLDTYLNGGLDIDGLRDQAVAILKEGMSQALGETRQPANDVTLWAQSHGVASLYKPVLATLALGLDPCSRKGNGELDYNSVTWRLLGVGWNGLGFVQSGRKPGDILRRQEILQEISVQLQRLLDVQYPVGNLFYEDLNGLFFTFPGLHGQEEQAEALVRELAPEIVKITGRQSDEELWPFLTLSEPRRTLTTITREIEARDGLAALPRVAALLSLERDGDQREEKLVVDGPALSPPLVGQDICPVCQFRSKQQREDACEICQTRRSGRQAKWQGEPHGQTIWIDEVADRNNRFALVTLRFDLSRWLSGEWLTTIWSQALSEWAKGERLTAAGGNIVRPLRELVQRGAIQPPDQDYYGSAKSLANWLLQNPTRTECKPVLEAFLETGGGEYHVSEVPSLLQDVEDIYGKREAESLLSFFFTQNASPARLARIWEETETFLATWISEIATETFTTRPQRLSFATVIAIPGVQAGQTYRIVVPRLTPGPLAVLCLDERRQDFLTVDSLEKFRFEQGDRRLQGVSAVQYALKGGGIESWLDEATGTRLPSRGSSTVVHVDGFQTEPYLPFIVLARSPVFCQLLLPANRTAAALQQLLALAEERFGKVQGKLPLHVGVLVAKRRFPLYALIEAGQQALDDPSFREGTCQRPWWGTAGHADDPFYGQYPTVAPSNGVHRLTDLKPVDHARPFWLTPGYFDFDFLGSTADRHRLTYERGVDGRPSRPAIAYGHLQPRPFPLHRLRAVFDIWNLLTAHLTVTQLHYLEEALATKLAEWDEIGNEMTPVFACFATALLRRSFGGRWIGLEADQRDLLERSARDGLLLETLELFRHVLKEGTSDE